MSFSYYSYGAGDCLSLHDDTAQDARDGQRTGHRPPLRRLALVTYLHEEWHPDWGGELMVYSNTTRSRGSAVSPLDLAMTHCIEPRPGTLVLFAVPRFHRVSRLDPLIGDERRLSIAGWFMTDRPS